MMRYDGRRPDEHRPVEIKRQFTRFAEGSVLVRFGDTWVVCTASVEDRVPPFLRGSEQGWVTAEFSMLPRSTQERSTRSATTQGRQNEIQRLIGRSLRAVTCLQALGEKTVIVDCDVLQADGGTRTAAITGGFVALVDALSNMAQDYGWSRLPITEFVAATSVGLIDDGQVVVDLCYDEDVRAGVDMNVVMTESGRLIEVQGAAEKAPFDRNQLIDMVDVAMAAVKKLTQYQREVIGDVGPLMGDE